MGKKSMGRGLIILSISSILVKLLSALYVPALKSIITDNGYGIYIVGYEIFILLFAITSVGTQQAIAKVVSEFNTLGNSRAALDTMRIAKRYLFVYGGIISLVFMVISFPLAKIIGRPQSSLSFLFLSPAIVLAAVLSSYRGYMQGVNDMVSLGVSNIIEQIINIFLSLVFAFLFMKISIEWGSAGGTIGTSVGAILAIAYIRYIFKRKYNSDQLNSSETSNYNVSKRSIIKKLTMYCIPITIVAIIQSLSGVIDVVTVGLGLETLGLISEMININTSLLYYYRTLINVPFTIITSLGIAIFPKVIKSFLENSKEELRIQTGYFYKLIYTITIPSVFGLAVLSKEIYGFLFDLNYGYELLIYGGMVLVFMSVYSIQNTILQGINKFRLIIITGIIGLTAKLICNITLINIEGINIMGAVIGSYVAFIIPTIVNHIKLQKYFGVKIPIIKQTIVPLISSSIMTIIILVLKYQVMSSVLKVVGGRVGIAIGTMILIVMGGFVYFIAIVLLKGVTKYDLDTISPKLYEVLPKYIKRNL
ncbi:MAG: polysaccharide biosynthesis protein [Clostridium sp.]|uniref:polysaccharide biosynthesis protein n=1 Tax=Clostridium sp. TaxID=1506 RepID=UPI0030342182